MHSFLTRSQRLSILLWDAFMCYVDAAWKNSFWSRHSCSRTSSVIVTISLVIVWVTEVLRMPERTSCATCSHCHTLLSYTQSRDRSDTLRSSKNAWLMSESNCHHCGGLDTHPAETSGLSLCHIHSGPSPSDSSAPKVFFGLYSIWYLSSWVYAWNVLSMQWTWLRGAGSYVWI